MTYTAKITVFPALITLISFLGTLYVYQFLPDMIVTHWGLYGEPNGWSSRSFELYFLPILSIFLYSLLFILPQLDPYKKNVEEFQGYFENFFLIIFVFINYIHWLTLVWNLGYTFNMIQFLVPGLCLLFYYAGVLTGNSRRNWFVGVRTPWTLSNDQVWQKTHNLMGKYFKDIALIGLLGIFLPQYALFIIVIPILFSVPLSFIYSYLEYRKLEA